MIEEIVGYEICEACEGSGGYCCGGEGQVAVIIRFMSKEEIEERANLNQANTATAIRRRTLREAAKANGKART